MTRKRFAIARAAGVAMTALQVTIAPASAQSISDLERRINEMQKELEELKAAQKKSSESDVKVKWEPAPSISSADGRFSMNLRGRILVDAGWVNVDNDPTATGANDVDATEFRAARLGIEGKAWNNVKYKFEADFANNDVAITDAYIGYDFGMAEAMVGHYKTFNSLEELTSSRYISFLERGGITDAFGLARQIGIGAQFGGDVWSFGAGVFKGDADGGANSDQGETFSARVTFAPKISDQGIIHIGAHYRYRKAGPDDGLLRYRQRPHHHIATRFVDTGAFARKDELYGAELAGVFGPFSAQGEYMVLKATPDMPVAGFGKPKFDGYYMDFTWFVTGESRSYGADGGTFGRVKVASPVHDGGFGAWQVGVRYDYVDLVDENILGGRQKSWIFGVNWHLNNYSRIMLNYSRSDVKQSLRGGNIPLVGTDGAADIDTFGLRAQVDW